MLLYFSRFGWTQTRTLKFRGRKNTHSQLSQAKTWNPLQRGFTGSQHAIQNLPFCSLQSSFLPKSRSGVWLRDGPCWPEAAVGLCLRLPLTPWSCIALFCTVHWKLCTLSSMENKGLWEVMQSPVEFSVLLIQLVNHSDCLLNLTSIVLFIRSFRQQMGVIICVPGCHANTGHVDIPSKQYGFKD